MNFFFGIKKKTMSVKKQNDKNLFISVIHGNKHDNHKVLINERFFALSDIKKWRLYLKLILRHIFYLYEINKEDFDLFLKDVIKEVNKESKEFKRRME